VNVHSLTAAEPFTTADGSTIRELWHTEAQSLAAASKSSRPATRC